MAGKPTWYTQLQFSASWKLSALGGLLAGRGNGPPPLPGCYVFTDYPTSLVPDDVLYVGTARCLRARLRAYVSPTIECRAKPIHRARWYLTGHRQMRGDDRIWVRWTVYAYHEELEASLIDMLNPAFNTRDEGGGYDDIEPLDPDGVIDWPPGTTWPGYRRG